MTTHHSACVMHRARLLFAAPSCTTLRRLSLVSTPSQTLHSNILIRTFPSSRPFAYQIAKLHLPTTFITQRTPASASAPDRAATFQKRRCCLAANSANSIRAFALISWEANQRFERPRPLRFARDAVDQVSTQRPPPPSPWRRGCDAAAPPSNAVAEAPTA